MMRFSTEIPEGEVYMIVDVFGSVTQAPSAGSVELGTRAALGADVTKSIQNFRIR